MPKSAQPWVSTLVRTIFEQPDAASVRAQHAQVAAALEAKLPQAAAHLDAARGLSGVQLVISDDHAGLVNAIAAVLPGAGWQRCRTHYHRNLLTRVPKTAQPWVSTLVRTIFEQPDPASVRAQHAQVVAALEAKLPQAAAHLDEAREDILAFTAFPREVWRQIWSNNPLSVNRPSGDTIVPAA